MKKIFAIGTLLFLAGCLGDDLNSDEIVTAATITEFRTEECHCCPSVTLETADSTYTVDEFPDFALEENELPLDVLVVLTDYKGECPGRLVSADYLN